MNKQSLEAINLVLRNRKKNSCPVEKKEKSFLKVVVAAQYRNIVFSIYEIITGDNLSVGDEIILLNEDMNDFLNNHILTVVSDNEGTYYIAEKPEVINSEPERKNAFLNECRKARM